MSVSVIPAAKAIPRRAAGPAPEGCSSLPSGATLQFATAKLIADRIDESIKTLAAISEQGNANSHLIAQKLLRLRSNNGGRVS